MKTLTAALTGDLDLNGHYKIIELPAMFGSRLEQLHLVLRILLENVVRNLQGHGRDTTVNALFQWLEHGTSAAEIPFIRRARASCTRPLWSSWPPWYRAKSGSQSAMKPIAARIVEIIQSENLEVGTHICRSKCWQTVCACPPPLAAPASCGQYHGKQRNTILLLVHGCKKPFRAGLPGKPARAKLG